MELRRAYTREELQKACQLLLEMRDNCRKDGGRYDDPKRKVKSEALDIALTAIGEMPDWMRGESVKLDVLMEFISKENNAELQVYPTNDGRMKYELYVKVKEE